MKIINLTIENFLTIGQANLTLSDKGLVLIQGENKDDASADSNGSGKSSIPDALCWALYGETARGVKGDSVVNHKAKKNTMVSVVVEDDGSSYTIVRHRKHKDHKNRLMVYVNADDKTKGTDKLTQDFIVELLGCSLDVFRAAVYAGQEAMPDLPGMTDKQLKVLVEESAGTDKLQKAHDIAKEKHRIVKANLDAVVGLIETAKRTKENSENMALGYKTDRANWEIDRADKIAVRKLSAKTKLDQAKEERSKVDDSVVETLKSELEVVKNSLASVNEENEKQRDLRHNVNEAQTNLRVALNSVETAKKQFEQAKVDLERVEHKVGEACGECGKTHTEDDVKDLRIIATKKLADAKANLVTVIKQAKDQQEASEIAQEALKTFEATMTDISASVEREREINASLSVFATRIDTSNRAKAEAERLIAEIADLGKQVNPYDHIITTELEKAANQEKVIAGLNKELEKAQEQVSVFADAVSVFGPAGVRAHILDTITPFLNERTSHYLSTMSDGNITAEWTTLATTTKGELREKFNIEVSNDKGADSFQGLSGGEKRKVRLSAAMALQDMVASRASKPIELFIADEVDHALDEAGLERLMAILNEKATERGTVLVISHNELSDWIRDQATVVKEGGYSTVSGALAA